MQIIEPWTMIPLDEADYFINFIRMNLPKNMKLQKCNLFTEAKIQGEDIYLIHDDDENKYFIIDLWKTKNKIKSIKNINVFIEIMKNDHEKFIREN